ncbi:hypothetical protein CBR_g47101 [Chara braunii]|uniref:Glycosyltransferase 2-like domain-containing protein n=1 Tax=Chara braunii TaxID=69332 RepID=A0A388M1P3_CHABU|nr:hypothetical protein CBR_g47101 [Chara braunii]|eukprot:GBG88402.1 hypothetical protein CBR_g47101 [Chara braunii]
MPVAAAGNIQWGKEKEEQGPLFSIVLAAYNQGKFLEETVQSVLKQTYSKWELIIVDDGSTDDTSEQSIRLLGRYPDKAIKVLRKRNGGLADARNIGLKLARGSWLCMLDSDDLLGSTYLERAADIVKDDKDVMIIPGCMENFDAATGTWCFPEGFSILGIANWNKFHASVLISRALMTQVGGYDPAIPWGLEDWNFWLWSSLYRPKSLPLVSPPTCYP